MKTIRQKAPEIIEKIRTGELTIPDGKRLAPLKVAVRKKVLKKLKEQGGGKLEELIEAVQDATRKTAGDRTPAPMTAAWTGEPESVPEPEEPQEEPAEEVDYVITAKVKLKMKPEEFEDLCYSGQTKWEVRNGLRRLLANVEVEEIIRA